MLITFDPKKRETVLRDRGLDLADASLIFDSFHLTRPDMKHSDIEDRIITVGQLGNDVVIVIWTCREDERRIITMWKANDREREAFRQRRQHLG